MSHHSKSKRQKRTRNDDIELEECENGGYNAIYIPDVNDSGDSDSGSDSESDDVDVESEPLQLKNFDNMPTIPYYQILDTYTQDQAKLEPNHQYEWLDGDKQYGQCLENEILLSDKTIKTIRTYSLVQLFELFFSNEMKSYIIEGTNLNGYPLTESDFQVLLGIIILSTFNKRKSQRDYWSTDPLLACQAVSSAMSRDKFMEIKSKIKLNKPQDKDNNDKAWRIRKVLEIFRKNLQQFGFFSTALSVDEMMIKFHGRTDLLQFMPNKPVRWGCKMWGIASPQGYLFDCDIYCGKGSNIYSSNKKVVLSKCALGSRVVLSMIQQLLKSKPVPKKLEPYHLYFDNLFCSPDLLVHLKKLGLQATGTVRANRVNTKNDLDKKSKKGTYAVKHEKNSGVNFITVMDSKPVSILSTAAGITPLHEVQRFSFEEKKKVSLFFPHAFKLYNLFMGGIDLHDLHCSNLMSFITAKKWTWPMFLKFIQSSMANGVVLHNLVHKEKIGTKEFAIALVRYYLAKSNKRHKHVGGKPKRNCEHYKKCAKRTKKMCEPCNIYLCDGCFKTVHL